MPSSLELALLGDLDYELSGVAAVEQQVERLGSVLEALHYSLAALQLAFSEPLAELRRGVFDLLEVVEDQEALHSRPLG